MTDTPQHIKDLHLKLWLDKTPGERLYLSIKDIEDMRQALRDIKKRKDLPLGDLDPVGEYLLQKEMQNNHQNNEKLK